MALPSRRLAALGHDGLVVVRSPRSRLSARVHVRSVWVTVVVATVALVAFAWSLAVGDFPVPITDVLASLAGGGSDDASFIVRALRLPRGVTALLVGAAFAVSGSVFQRLLRNPLASPDIIGVSAGAAAGAVFVIVASAASDELAPLGALGGATAAGAAMYLLAYRRGVTAYRFILVGIGVTAMLVSFTKYLLTTAEIHDASRVTVWLTGNLNGRGWAHVRLMVAVMAVLVPVTVALARQLRLLELGDDLARGAGGSVERARAGLILVATSLAAFATASAGPVAFVALVSPQLARRLVGTRSVGLLPAAALGALLLVASDLVARRAFAPTELPVGVVTAVLGAPYLLYLLARANRTGSGG